MIRNNGGFVFSHQGCDVLSAIPTFYDGVNIEMYKNRVSVTREDVIELIEALANLVDAGPQEIGLTEYETEREPGYREYEPAQPNVSLTDKLHRMLQERGFDVTS